MTVPIHHRGNVLGVLRKDSVSSIGSFRWHLSRVALVLRTIVAMDGLAEFIVLMVVKFVVLIVVEFIMG